MLTFRALALRQSEPIESIRLDKRLMFETSVLESLYGGQQFTFSYQTLLINQTFVKHTIDYRKADKLEDLKGLENDALFQKVTQAYSEKRNPSTPIRSRT